jgi:hypothetical protein
VLSASVSSRGVARRVRCLVFSMGVLRGCCAVRHGVCAGPRRAQPQREFPRAPLMGAGKLAAV